MSRSELEELDDADAFVDVANDEILEGREALGLENYVPFHWFTKNPFDYGAVRGNKDKEFVLITIKRAYAKRNNWQVICRHPLAREGVELLDYADGMESIDWDLMNKRDYDDDDCRSVCMAECLSPNSVPARNFFRIYVSSEENKAFMQQSLKKAGLKMDVDLNDNMLVGIDA